MLDTVEPGQTLLADRAYDSDAVRQRLAERGAWANVKPIPMLAALQVESMRLTQGVATDMIEQEPMCQHRPRRCLDLA